MRFQIEKQVRTERGWRNCDAALKLSQPEAPVPERLPLWRDAMRFLEGYNIDRAAGVPLLAATTIAGEVLIGCAGAVSPDLDALGSS